MHMASKVYLMIAWYESSISGRSLRDYAQITKQLVESILTPTRSQAACFMCCDCFWLRSLSR